MFTLLALTAPQIVAFCASVTTVLTTVNLGVTMFDHFQRLKPKKEPPD